MSHCPSGFTFGIRGWISSSSVSREAAHRIYVGWHIGPPVIVRLQPLLQPRAGPHSVLHYMRSVDYYRGDPAARLAERQQKLAQVVETRNAYWKAHSDVEEPGDPH